jgi:hypothetical protein
MRTKFFILPAEEVKRRTEETVKEGNRILKMIDEYNLKYPQPSTDQAITTGNISKK